MPNQIYSGVSWLYDLLLTSEEYPEGDWPVHHAQHTQKDDKGQHAKGRVGIGIDVRMPAERSFSFYRKEILILQKEVFNLAERSLNINLQKVLILKQRIFISRKGRFSILNFAEKNFNLAERKF